MVCVEGGRWRWGLAHLRLLHPVFPGMCWWVWVWVGGLWGVTGVLLRAPHPRPSQPLGLGGWLVLSPPPSPPPCRLVFSYEILTPAALTFFVSYAEGAVESLWSIDQYFEFVLVLMLSTGLSFQVGS